MADTAVETPSTTAPAKDVEVKAEKAAEIKSEDKSEDKKDTPEKSSSRSNGNSHSDRRDNRDRGDRKRLDRRGNERPPYQNKNQHNKNKKQFTDFKRNVKTNYDKLPETDDPSEIRKQVEFYFSDSNLAYDDYMNSLVGGVENKSVPISLLHGFKRMRRFQPFSAVVAALKESETLDVIEGDELRRKVAWKKPDTEGNELTDPTIPSSIYAKGFGDEEAATQFDVENFFAPYGPINSVRLRRKMPSREFKGSVFVEFETVEGQREFLELEDKPKWKGGELQFMSKREYCEGKLKDIEAGKIPANKKESFKQYQTRPPGEGNQNDKHRSHGRNDRNDRGGRDRNRSRNRRDGGRRDRDRDDWKGRREDFQRNGNRSPKREKDADDEEDSKAKVEPEEASEAKEAEAPVEESKKRERDDEGAEEEKSPKKAKAEEIEA